MNIFDIMGPIMVGPSSSHTAGAARIGYLTRKLLGAEPRRAELLLHGSFAATGAGHGTDRALVAGLLGMRPDDARLPRSFELARAAGMEVVLGRAVLRGVHPNSVLLKVEDASGGRLEVTASSLGGGRVQVCAIDGLEARFTGEMPTLIIRNQDRPGMVAEVSAILSRRRVNIAAMQLYRNMRGGLAVMVIESDQPIWAAAAEELRACPGIQRVTYLDMEGGAAMAFSSVAGLLEAAGDRPLWRAVLEDDLAERGVPEERSRAQMAALWTAMRETAAGYDPAARSHSGLTGGAGALLEGEGPLCGPFLRQVIATALKTGECNACMRRIVAAPTAGASGVLPAVLLPLQARDGLEDERMIQALYVAGGFGQVIAARASISGAEGGCQAEVGSASGMAAAALVHVMGGTAEQMAHACAMALSNTLGLVCDPVAGLVEVPCVNRNVMGAVNALACAEMALAGVESVIPCDEVIDAMRSVGDALPASLRETGGGGLAATPTGRRIAERM